jgi:hypothetical protein
LVAPAALRLTAPCFASLLRPAKYQTRPFKLLLLNLYIRAQFGALCKISKTVQLPRHVAAAKEP